MAGENFLGFLDGGTNLAAGAANVGSSIYDFLFIVLTVLLFLGIVGFILWFNSFKHTVLIREITSTRKFIVKDAAKIRRNKEDGVEYWYLRRRRVELTSPKPESIEITKKGRFYAECYHDLESGKDAGYSWLMDDGVGNFTSYSAESKALVTARIRRAAERKGTGLFQMIMTVAAISIPLIALIVTFSFWGDLTKETTDASNKLTAAMNNFVAKTSDYSVCSQSLGATPLTPTPQQTINPNVPLDAQGGGS